MLYRRVKTEGNIKYLKCQVVGCVARFSSGAYTRMQFLSAVSHSMGAHTEALRPTEDSSSSDEEETATAATTTSALGSVDSTSPRGTTALRGVSGGTMPGVRVGAVWARTLL